MARCKPEIILKTYLNTQFPELARYFSSVSITFWSIEKETQNRNNIRIKT